MGRVRDHEPIIIEEINGLWARGDDESCPSDHLLLAENVQFFHSGIETRTGLQPYAQQTYSADLRQTRRVYNYTTTKGQGLLVLVNNGTAGATGTIYHVVSPTEIYLVLSKVGMEDFAFIAINGRAYISPFKTYTNATGQNISLGLKDEYIYVYDGDKNTPQSSSSARLAGGNPPTNGSKKPFIVYNNELAGKVTAGTHVVGVAFNDGIIGPEAQITVEASGDRTLKLLNIPKGPGGTTSRTIVMTKAGTPYAPGVDGVFFKAVTIPDNTTETFILDIDDAGLTAYTQGATAAPAPGAMFVFNPNIAGNSDAGLHLFGVVYETNTGYMTAPGPEFFTAQTLIDSKVTRISAIPTSPDFFVVKRHIVATKAIPDFYNGDQKGYQFFFVPKGTLDNNTATTIDLNFYDSDLVADASHLIDNYAKIPSCVNFCQYHSRLVMVGDSTFPEKVDGTPDTTKPDNRSVARLSAPGEPEAVSKVDGLIVTPLDGNPLTNCKTFRDILYLFKASRTYAYADNEDEPATWKEEILDQGVGTCVHGIAEVLDTGGVNVDFLIIADFSGLMLFNGTYARPELTWKIENIWINFYKERFHELQVINDTIRKKLWVLEPAFPSSVLYHADYGNGLDPKNIRWARWSFNSTITTIALLKRDKLILGTWQPNSLLPLQEIV